MKKLIVLTVLTLIISIQTASADIISIPPKFSQGASFDTEGNDRLLRRLTINVPNSRQESKNWDKQNKKQQKEKPEKQKNYENKKTFLFNGNAAYADSIPPEFIIIHGKPKIKEPMSTDEPENKYKNNTEVQTEKHIQKNEPKKEVKQQENTKSELNNANAAYADINYDIRQKKENKTETTKTKIVYASLIFLIWLIFLAFRSIRREIKRNNDDKQN